MSTLTSGPTGHSAPHTAMELNEIKKTQYPDYGKAPGRRHFWLRRVHSLLGLVFGAYVTVHLIVNASGFWPRAYQQNVDKIHSLQPMLPLIEIGAIFLPLLFHAFYGIYITWAGVKFNTMKYNYGGNVRYTAQRWAGVILLLFLLYHVGTLHHWGIALFGVKPYPLFNPQNTAYQSTVAAIKTPYASMALNLAVIAFYLLGTWAAVFHWANGFWTAAIAWGLTTTANAQRKWGHVCFMFGAVMFLVGTMAWVAFAVAGDPKLDKELTRTLPDETSQLIHAPFSSGQQTKQPHAPGEVPATQQH